MQRQAKIQAIVLQTALALALLLGTATHALAQAAGHPAAIDPNSSSVDDVLDEPRGDTTVGGSATSDDPAQLGGTDAAEVDAGSTRSGPQVDENGERGVPFAGDRLLFLPAVKTDGAASTRMSSESAAAAAAGTPAGQSQLGDFNGDGYDDLAVGVPYEDVVTGGTDNIDAGSVTVIYGSASGLTAAGNQVWTQGTAGMLDVVEQGDTFGNALAVGDFNGDGCDDLAIGVANEGFTNEGLGRLAAAGADVAVNFVTDPQAADDVAQEQDVHARMMPFSVATASSRASSASAGSPSACWAAKAMPSANGLPAARSPARVRS